MQRAPLAQDLAVGARVDDLVGRDAGERIARDVADAVAAGLDAVHVDLGERVHHVGALVKRDPVELQVLARREVPVAAVVLARNQSQRAQLLRRQQSVGNRDPQHRRMALDVPAVLQPQRAELVVAQLAGEVALQLVAVLGRALAHDRIHGGRITLHHGFHRGIAAIAHPARYRQPVCFAAHGIAEKHALHATMNHEVQCLLVDLLHSHSFPRQVSDQVSIFGLCYQRGSIM